MSCVKEGIEIIYDLYYKLPSQSGDDYILACASKTIHLKAMFCDKLINTLCNDDTETCLLIYALLICHLEAKCQ